MAAKDVQFGNEVRQKMVNGANILANAVRVTLGKGRNVVVDRAFGGPAHYQRRRYRRQRNRTERQV